MDYVKFWSHSLQQYKSHRVILSKVYPEESNIVASLFQLLLVRSSQIVQTFRRPYRMEKETELVP